MVDETKPTLSILDELDDEPDTSPTPVAVAPISEAAAEDGWDEGAEKSGDESEEGEDGWTESTEVETVLPDSEAAGEMAPKKRKRRSKEEMEAAREGLQPLQDGEATYVVQRGFTVEGKTYHPGDTILVKCKYCALWKKEWGGKVRCHPDKEWGDGSTMSADKFSCASFFICKELEAELDNFLSMELQEVLTVRRMLTASKQLLATETWVRKHFGEDDSVNPAAVFLNAKGFVTSFTSVDQLVLSEVFIRTYATLMADKAKARARSKKAVREKKPVFGRGDWVEWTDSQTNLQVKGIIMYSSKGNIHIAGIDGPLAGQNLTFNAKEWKEKMSPKILRKAASVEG